jgi:hypothetical protein
MDTRTEWKQYLSERWALASRQLNCPEDIAKLPWQGNHASDMGLFTACEKLIRRLPDREQQKQAFAATAKYGMGYDGPVSDAELDDFLEENTTETQR